MEHLNFERALKLPNARWLFVAVEQPKKKAFLHNHFFFAGAPFEYKHIFFVIVKFICKIIGVDLIAISPLLIFIRNVLSFSSSISVSCAEEKKK
jgi:hypothetical protein